MTEGHAQPLGYQKYLGVISDATVEILGKSYDRRIARDMARCHHMASVGCGKSLDMFRVSLPFILTLHYFSIFVDEVVCGVHR